MLIRRRLNALELMKGAQLTCVRSLPILATKEGMYLSNSGFSYSFNYSKYLDVKASFGAL